MAEEVYYGPVEQFSKMEQLDPNEIKNSSSQHKEAHRTRLAKTVLINLAFLFGIGLINGGIGPVLLDLKEVYNTSVETISFMFMIRSTGSLIGCFFAGFIMRKFPNRHDLMMFFYLSSYSISSAMMPFLGHIYVLFFLSFFHGFLTAAIDTSGNVMCLNIWRGLDHGGPSMHSIHFSFALGATLAPLIAAPFLSVKQFHDLNLTGNNNYNGTMDVDGQTQVYYYFPSVSVIPLLVSFGFLSFAFRSSSEMKRLQKMGEENEKEIHDTKKKEENQEWTRTLVLFVGSLLVFFFLYAGAEVNLGIYLTTFAVECDLELTKVEGANLTAIFFGCFAAMRFLAIFAAFKMNPLHIMVFSFVCSTVSSVALVFYAQTSFIVLQICVAVLGVGMASIYATGLLWLEQYTVITSYIGALFTIGASLGPDVFLIIIGQFIVKMPMLLMYVNLGTILVCIFLFVLASFAGSAHKQRMKLKNETQLAEKENLNSVNEGKDSYTL